MFHNNLDFRPEEREISKRLSLQYGQGLAEGLMFQLRLARFLVPMKDLFLWSRRHHVAKQGVCFNHELPVKPPKTNMAMGNHLGVRSSNGWFSVVMFVFRAAESLSTKDIVKFYNGH